MRAVPTTVRGSATVGAGDTLLLPSNYVRMALLIRITTFVPAYISIGDPNVNNFLIRHDFILPPLLLRRIDFGPALGAEIWIRSPTVSTVTFLETSNDDIMAGYLGF